MEEKLTIFYNRRTGSIKEMCGGIQSMDWFGDEKQDYEQIFDFLIADYDEYILQNSHQFEVVDGKVKLKENNDLSKYM